MYRLSEALRSNISETLRGEVEKVLIDMTQEAEQKEQGMRNTQEKLLQDIMELVAKKNLEKQKRQNEKERLEAAVEAARQEERERFQDESFMRMKQEVERETDVREKLREKRYALEKDNRWQLFQLELKKSEYYDKKMAEETDKLIKQAAEWDRLTKKRVDVTLTTTISAAVMKQQLLMELKNQAGKWMESDDHNQDTSSTQTTPQVLRGWMLREGWRKLHNNGPCLNDQVQSFYCHKDIEQVIMQNQRLQRICTDKFDKELKRHMAEKARGEEKIRAAALKERKELEEKIKKETEKKLKAEMNEKMKGMKAKEKKQAE